MARQKPVDGLRLESVITPRRSFGISMIVERLSLLERLCQKLNVTHVKSFKTKDDMMKHRLRDHAARVKPCRD